MTTVYIRHRPEDEWRFYGNFTDDMAKRCAEDLRVQGMEVRLDSHVPSEYRATR